MLFKIKLKNSDSIENVALFVRCALMDRNERQTTHTTPQKLLVHQPKEINCTYPIVNNKIKIQLESTHSIRDILFKIESN